MGISFTHRSGGICIDMLCMDSHCMCCKSYLFIKLGRCKCRGSADLHMWITAVKVILSSRKTVTVCSTWHCLLHVNSPFIYLWKLSALIFPYQCPAWLSLSHYLFGVPQVKTKWKLNGGKKSIMQEPCWKSHYNMTICSANILYCHCLLLFLWLQRTMKSTTFVFLAFF